MWSLVCDGAVSPNAGMHMSKRRCIIISITVNMSCVESCEAGDASLNMFRIVFGSSS
jgi:hypothetical protein